MTLRDELGFNGIQTCELYVPDQDRIVAVVFDGRELAVDGVTTYRFTRDGEPGARAILYRTIESPDSPVLLQQLRPEGNAFQSSSLLKRSKALLDPLFRKYTAISPITFALEPTRSKLDAPKIDYVIFNSGTKIDSDVPDDIPKENMSQLEINNFMWSRQIREGGGDNFELPFSEMDPNVVALLSILNRHEGREVSVQYLQEIFTSITGIALQHREFIQVLGGFVAEYKKHEQLNARIKFRTIQGQGHFVWMRRRYTL